MSSLGYRIELFRTSASWSQVEFAQKLGLSQSAISKWERGEGAPTIDRVEEMARLFGVSREHLMGRPDKVDSLGRRVSVIDSVECVQNGRSSATRGRPIQETYVHLPIGLEDEVVRGYTVKDDCADVHFPSGSIVYVLEFLETVPDFSEGAYYLLSKAYPSGDTGRLIMQYAVSVDGSGWFWPKSKNPRCQNPISELKSCDGIRGYSVVGQIVAATIPLWSANS